MSKTALLGLHDLSSFTKRLIESAGYNTTVTDSVDGMLEAMEVQGIDDPNSPPRNPFDLYLMDVNLGDPGQIVIYPAERVYGHVLAQEGDPTFIAITSLHTEFIEAARERGIPCYTKDTELIDLLVNL